MNPGLVLPIVTILARLVSCGVSLASFQLGWSKVIKLALAWFAIFAGMFLIVEWFVMAEGTASALIRILHNIYYPS